MIQRFNNGKDLHLTKNFFQKDKKKPSDIRLQARVAIRFR